MSASYKRKIVFPYSELIIVECSLSVQPKVKHPHGVIANVLNCDILVSEFEFQSRYYVRFQTNTLRKDMKHLFSLPGMVLIVPLMFSYNDGLGIK